MLLSEGFGWYTFQPPSSAVSTTLVGHYYSGVYTEAFCLIEDLLIWRLAT